MANLSISLLESSPGTELNEGTKSIERFNELNSRWKTINKLREEQISNTGTRTIIESMATADIPELLPDKEAHFETKKDQKLYYTNILKERRNEFT